MPEPGVEKVFDIRERAFEFAVRVVKLCKYLERNSGVSRSVISQLLRAGTSVGANLEEARAGQSTADFIHKNAVSLKEARETHYWLKLILATESLDEGSSHEMRELKDEVLELCKIIGKIIVTSKK